MGLGRGVAASKTLDTSAWWTSKSTCLGLTIYSVPAHRRPGILAYTSEALGVFKTSYGVHGSILYLGAWECLPVML